MSLAQTLKSIIKGKSNMAEASEGQTEGGLLKRYLMSRGIDPRYVSKDTRISHSKSGEFMKWKQDHISESVDKKDTITLDIPLIIRVLELAREDIKSDMDLHRVVEKLIEIRNKGTLTMDDYEFIANIKEDYKQVIETYFGPRGDKLIARSHAAHKAGDAATGSRAHKLAMKAGEKYRSNPTNSAKATAHVMGSATQDYKDQEKKRGIGNVRDHVEVDGTVVEAKEANYGGDYQDSVKALKAKAEKKPVDMKSLAARMQASYAKDKKTVKEELDPVRQKELTRSARIIKSLYKNQKVQADKDGTQKTPEVQAAAVLKGGKTMTGQPRDTIEIDPMLRTRPGTPDPSKNVKK
jgi:hypothetical protein